MFQLNTTVPAEAIIRINLAKDENVEKYGGRIWNTQKADGNFAFLGTIQQTANVSIQGHKIADELNEVSTEIRVSQEDMLNLLEALEDYTVRIAEVKLSLTQEPAMKTLTLRNGTRQNAVVLFGTITGVRAGATRLDSDTFTSKEELVNFLAGNRQVREAQRIGMRMAQQSQNSNILS